MCCSSCWHRLLLECVARGQRACFATPPVQPPNQEWVNSTPWPTLLAALANCSEEDAMASVFKDFSKLGQGRFGKVFKLPTVALKIKRRASDMEAVALQAVLNQDHILQRLHFEQSPLHEVLALELCECSLADSPGQTTSFPFWSRDLIRGLHCLQLGLCHADVNPANILLKNGQLRLADLGACSRMTNPRPGGSLRYQSPEVLRGEAPSASADLWSAGVTMYEVMAGEHFAQTRQFAGHSFRQIREDLCDAVDEALSNGIPNPDRMHRPHPETRRT